MHTSYDSRPCTESKPCHETVKPLGSTKASDTAPLVGRRSTQPTDGAKRMGASTAQSLYEHCPTVLQVRAATIQKPSSHVLMDATPTVLNCGTCPGTASMPRLCQTVSESADGSDAVRSSSCPIDTTATLVSKVRAAESSPAPISEPHPTFTASTARCSTVGTHDAGILAASEERCITPLSGASRPEGRTARSSSWMGMGGIVQIHASLASAEVVKPARLVAAMATVYSPSPSSRA
mmetsp:Transcript_600/g.1604  ORF Transcript_600/g.1604 Transcript_600/m.1604 type:complete len:236 (+) Transcript_600:359-1066(+)